MDGFRFDLASIMTRAHSLWHQQVLGSDGKPVAAHSQGPIVNHDGACEGVGDEGHGVRVREGVRVCVGVRVWGWDRESICMGGAVEAAGGAVALRLLVEMRTTQQHRQTYSHIRTHTQSHTHTCILYTQASYKHIPYACPLHPPTPPLPTHTPGMMTDGAGTPTGTPLSDPPLVEMISEDPVLRNTKLIAEAWDCDGLNQVGAFPHYGGRWGEWNGHFRDTVRQFIKVCVWS